MIANLIASRMISDPLVRIMFSVLLNAGEHELTCVDYCELSDHYDSCIIPYCW